MSGKTIGKSFLKISMSLGIVAMLAGASGIMSLSLVRQDILGASEKIDRRMKILNPAYDALEKMIMSTVQVQQFLSDISATRGQDGLNDGLDLAEKSANSFHDHLTLLVKYSNQDSQLGKSVLPHVDKLNAAFKAYYDLGKEMAATYMKEGPKGGNAMMPKFDEKSEKLQDEIETVETSVEGIVQQSLTEQTVSMDNMIASASMWRLVLTAAMGIVLLFVIVAVVLARSTGRRLSNVVSDIDQVSKGMSVEVKLTGKGDDIDEINSALLRFIEVEENKKRMEAEEAERNAREKARRERIDSATAVFDSAIAGSLGKMKEIVTKLHRQAKGLQTNATEATSQSSAVAAATEQATANVESVSAASAELSASIQEIARQVSRSTDIIESATTEVSDASGRITGLSDAVTKIGEVIDLITGIADQTNLLALNATIESARAGDAGKGFAVVATEVKNLASQTGSATEDIATQIGAVQSETTGAVDSVKEITKTITQIHELSAAIASAVEQQEAATGEISRNVSQASQGTKEVAMKISDVARMAGETGRMAEDLFVAANEMMEESDNLTGAVDSFLKEVRMA